ncbi:MAG: hypothetical protein EXS37_12710 [Opitutus sp.]|nr:hypothetical protein [Opitutus sp.]
MRPIVFIGLGFGFIIMGAFLFALSVRKPKAPLVNPNKSQLREQSAMAEETRKMRLGAAVIAGFGAVLALFGIF